LEIINMKLIQDIGNYKLNIKVLNALSILSKKEKLEPDFVILFSYIPQNIDNIYSLLDDKHVWTIESTESISEKCDELGIVGNIGYITIH